MEVKIGVQYAAREIVVESSQTPEAVEELITAAVKAGGLLTLADERGRVRQIAGESFDDALQIHLQGQTAARSATAAHRHAFSKNGHAARHIAAGRQVHRIEQHFERELA